MHVVLKRSRLNIVQLAIEEVDQIVLSSAIWAFTSFIFLYSTFLLRPNQISEVASATASRLYKAGS